MNISKKRKGFTLIELVIVVAIIGILLLMILPQFQNITRSTARRTVETNYRNIISAYTMYQAENAGAAPSSEDDVEKFIDGGFPDDDVPEGASYSLTNGVVTVEYDGNGDASYAFSDTYPHTTAANP